MSLLQRSLSSCQARLAPWGYHHSLTTSYLPPVSFYRVAGTWHTPTRSYSTTTGSIVRKHQTRWTFKRKSSTKSNDDNGANGLSVAIVGSGPSGCYTAKYLRSALQKSSIPNSKMHILDRLPTPFGLVRSGVAPDHPEVKNVQHDFESSLFKNRSTEIEFKGNVKVGQDVSLQELQSCYHVVVLAYGCESDRKLNIPGEDALQGILSAREFVAWYNGHPDYGHVGHEVAAALGPHPEKNGQVVVIGQGNVALDCARILAKGGNKLVDTDMASHALGLFDKGVHQTTIVGRRGHVQGAFTIKELRELVKLQQEGFDASFVVSQEELEMGMTPASQEELNGPGGRPRTRINKLLLEAAAKNDNHCCQKQVSLRFLMNPVEFQQRDSDPSRLGAVVCERAKLEGEPGKQVAVGTGQYEIIPAQLALVSIGYKGVALPGVDDLGCFDTQRGIVRNVHGKVDGVANTGLYVSGWLKRGPSGIIGTNIADAKDTVSTIMKDIADHRQDFVTPKKHNLDDILQERGVNIVDWSSYEKIAAAESDPARKRSEVQPREKLVTWKELLNAAEK